MTSLKLARKDERGSALLVALIAVMVIGALAGSMAVVSTSRSSERNSSLANTKSLYIAEAGMSMAVDQVMSGGLAAVIGANGPFEFGGGQYTTNVTDNGNDTVTIVARGTYGGITRATQVSLEREGGGVFENALFAGNSSGDAAYQMKFGGTGTSADLINGNIYSGGNIKISGTPTFNGSLSASGVVSGGSFPVGSEPETGASQPIPDIAGMNYAVNHDYDVKSMFASATYKSNSSLGGSAWQLPESNPAHIFRKNPSDRSSNTSTTAKDDYFLEDPYESVNTSSTVSPDKGTKISLSGHNGNSGSSGSNKVYYIDGNLWIHNNNLFNFTMYNSGSEAILVTFVVKGNIYFSDNIMYQGNREDGVAFIAIKDSAQNDSGNIYFGDPSFGTLERMDAFMYAENNFYDNNLSASGSAKVTVNGNMTAGNQVLINRDSGGKHSKLTVNFDERLLDSTIDLPGLPDQGAQAVVWNVRSWNEVAAAYP